MILLLAIATRTLSAVSFRNSPPDHCLCPACPCCPTCPTDVQGVCGDLPLRPSSRLPVPVRAHCSLSSPGPALPAATGALPGGPSWLRATADGSSTTGGVCPTPCVPPAAAAAGAHGTWLWSPSACTTLWWGRSWGGTDGGPAGSQRRSAPHGTPLKASVCHAEVCPWH